MDYEQVTDDMKQQMRDNVLLQIEQEHYLNTLARERALVRGNTKQADELSQLIASLEAERQKVSELK